MEEHVNYPYAIKEEKKQLMFATGLSEHQITQYLSNYRRRRLPKNNIKFKRSKYNMKNNPKKHWGIISSYQSIIIIIIINIILLQKYSYSISIIFTVCCLLEQGSEQRQVE